MYYNITAYKYCFCFKMIPILAYKMGGKLTPLDDATDNRLMKNQHDVRDG